MLSDLQIRHEDERDYFAVESMIREAFWNLYRPGCDEHYIVHKMRQHEDYLPELSLIAEHEGQIVASIHYTKSLLRSETGIEKEIVTFGPLAVRPGYQRQGIGKALIKRSLELARKEGYDTVVIMGYPENYLSSGFKSSKDFRISLDGKVYPLALLVLTFDEEQLRNQEWTYQESQLFHNLPEEADKYDELFPVLKRGHQLSQDIFELFSQAVLTDM